MNRTALIVDNNKQTRHTLNQLLCFNGWQVICTSDIQQAIAHLSQQSIQVVISSHQQIKGAKTLFLDQVSKDYPSIIRIALISPQAIDDDIKVGYFAHHTLANPIQLKEFSKDIERISEMLTLFPNKVIQAAIASITSLPIAPKLFFQVKRKLADDNSSMQDIAKLISQDPAMCTKIIQTSNNAIFRGHKEISSISEAITRLGGQVISSIVGMLEVYSLSADCPNQSLEELQSQSLRIAVLASSLVSREYKDQTFLIGILHRVGEYVRTMIVDDLMKSYLNDLTQGSEKSHLEQYLFHTTSEQLGGYLLHFWGFPLYIIESILTYNDPEKLTGQPFGPVSAVYIASKIIKNQTIDNAFIEHFQLVEKIQEWKEPFAHEQ